ncbi:hypothetical protein HD598_002168 [Neomicrococcus aestuarii]|uniref:Uncharacterized protein n=1 Tax=Neomicrococcus aestuarii TaxID=556325 RepID=A0A7W8TXU2_9MICC|nr:hypothetical protein [Neomicrococcus aestuarii]MBB5513481.1 hypothetical protein [Neomicrococcus aestuarii]
MPTFSNGAQKVTVSKPTRAEIQRLKALGFFEEKPAPIVEAKPVNPSK